MELENYHFVDITEIIQVRIPMGTYPNGGTGKKSKLCIISKHLPVKYSIVTKGEKAPLRRKAGRP